MGAIKALPEIVQIQLHWEVYSSRLLAHPIFHQLSEVSNGVSEVCHKAMSEKSLYSKQDLFVANAKAESVFFIHTGILKYVFSEGHSEQTLDLEKQWVCEAALWIKWVHTGRLSAMTNSELLVLNAESFRGIASSVPGVHAAFCRYARRYREYALGGGVQQPLEVWYEFAKAQELAQDSFSEIETVEFVRPKLTAKRAPSLEGYLPGLWRAIS